MPKKKSGKKKKRRSSSSDGGHMPSGGAGLIRFFEDETPGIKVGPTLVVIFASIVIVGVIISHVLPIIFPSS